MKAGFLLPAGVFLAVSGFSFRFTSQGLQFIALTDHFYFILLLQMIFIVMLLLSVKTIREKDTVILSVLFLLTSAGFIINENEIKFLFWNQNTNIIGAGYILLSYVLAGLNIIRRNNKNIYG